MKKVLYVLSLFAVVPICAADLHRSTGSRKELFTENPKTQNTPAVQNVLPQSSRVTMIAPQFLLSDKTRATMCCKRCLRASL